ncbi:MAG: malonyl-CoA decarboxylase [Rhodomicrobium sp.]
MDVSFFQEILAKISERGRQILDLPALIAAGGEESFESLCEELASSRGEASGVALARRILDRYEETGPAGKDAIFAYLASRFVPNAAEAKKAAEAYLQEPGHETLERLAMAVEPPRQELLRRLNLAPGGTAALVRMREDLLQRMNTSLAGVDRDFVHLFSSWFNRGFLVLARMSWSSPASILEKIIAYEAVHEIKGWDDLRRRLDPHDRRCFAFFHPALVDEPLIFVEVALCSDIPASIHTLLESEGGPENADPEPTVAVFYSISNCQEGLRGISFGNFLIKQVVEELNRELPSLKTFVTLSPAPSFRSWLLRALGDGQLAYLGEAEKALLQKVREQGWSDVEADQDALGPATLAAAGHYYLLAKNRSGRPLDPVARFHLGNGARLERLNWLGDTSEKGIRQGLSLMVNYRYDLRDIERNHEAYVNQGSVIASKSVRALLAAPEKTRAAVPAQE